MAGIDLSPFKIMVREQIASALQTVAYYSDLVKQQIKNGMIWAAKNLNYYASLMQVWIKAGLANIGYGFNYVFGYIKYFFSNFRQLAYNALITVFNWLLKGFHYGYRFGAFLINQIGQFLSQIPRLLKALWNNLTLLYQMSIRFLSNLLHNAIDFIAQVLINIPKILNAIIKNLKAFFEAAKDLMVFLAKGLKHFCLNFVENMKALFEFGLEAIKAFAKNIHHCINHMVYFFKEVWYAIYSLGKYIANHAWQALSWVGQGIAKRLFMGIGMIYGLSAVLVETLGEGISAIALKAFGLNLANVAAFGALQTGLSVLLAAFIGYNIIRFGVWAVAGIFGLSFASRQPALAQAHEHEDVAQRAAPHVGAQNVYAPDFQARNRRSSSNDAQDEVRSRNRNQRGIAFG
ncbi:MAG: hypothetical protein AB7V32_08970 [Candidatus Berkiella sp.]